MEELAGKIIGAANQYQIERLISKQSGRRTLLAKEIKTQQTVVIKLVLFSPDFTWQDLKLFEREAKTLQALSHPAIPQYLDYFEVDIAGGKGFALVQTYIAAKSLEDWVSAGRTFSEADLKAIAQSLLSILNYLHNRNPPVIHRDIKPSNILLSADRSAHSPGTLYLVDFGSVQTAITTSTITVVGTYGYMPPEQFGNRAVPASDLYSLGATLAYLATGQHPADLMQDDMQIDLASINHLSHAFTHWIRRLTYPDMARRIRTVSAAQTSLDRLQEQSSSHRVAVAASAQSPSPTHSALALSEPYAPTRPLPPALKDLKVSATADLLEIRCQAYRVSNINAETSAKLSQQGRIHKLEYALFWISGFCITLFSAAIFHSGALVVLMAIAVVLFSLWFPMLTSKKPKQIVIGLSSERSKNQLSLTTLSPDSNDSKKTHSMTARQMGKDGDLNFSHWTVRSLSTGADFITGNRLIITLSAEGAPEAWRGTPQIQLSGSQQEIWWLREHIRRWGRAPID